jgi:UDP-N-acetylglucosamine 2-epimerase (hydrolysing)
VGGSAVNAARQSGGSAPRKVLFLTGTRADFGKLKPLIEEIHRVPDFEVFIFATGMHMLSRYGSTVSEIEKAGFLQVFPYINQYSSVDSQMDLVLANTIYGLSHYVREFPPDLLVVHGDRTETLAGAIVGALNNILVAHVEGGEVSGTVDELIRHAVTKLCHIHFVANEDSRKRLVQLGEDPNLVFGIGSPETDIIFSERLPSIGEVKSRYDIPFAEYAILLYHPVTTEVDLLPVRIAAVVEAAIESQLNWVVLYPNNDTGSEVILRELKRVQSHSKFRVIPSMRFEHFLTLMNHAATLVGNSSAGIREAPVFGTPTINLGSRQMNRFHYPSILNVQEDCEAILKALECLPQSIAPSTYFGNGNCAAKFLTCLRDDRIWRVPKQKQFRDLEFLTVGAAI